MEILPSIFVGDSPIKLIKPTILGDSRENLHQRNPGKVVALAKKPHEKAKATAVKARKG